LPEKKGDITEIQKKYFQCYTEAKVRQKMQAMQENQAPDAERFIQEQIEIKKDLEQQGIKLRF
jgi:hypothetical protein